MSGEESQETWMHDNDGNSEVKEKREEKSVLKLTPRTIQEM